MSKNRKIKFRGKDIKGNWYYGNLSILTQKVGISEPGYYISNKVGVPFAHDVIPDTVGQFTGLLNRSGKEIYEGDIVRWLNPLQSKESYKKNPYRQVVVKWLSNLPGFSHFPAECEVIGNRWDNPELLKEKYANTEK